MYSSKHVLNISVYFVTVVIGALLLTFIVFNLLNFHCGHFHLANTPNVSVIIITAAVIFIPIFIVRGKFIFN